MRDELPLYWSHCGTYRLHKSTAQLLNKPALTNLEDIVELGAEVQSPDFALLSAICIDLMRLLTSTVLDLREI